MTSLPPPEQWVLSKMSEVEVAEMIEEHIDYYTEDKDGNRRSVHLLTPFVRHFMRRHDGVLPTVVAIATAPIVLADGVLLMPDGLDRDRGIQFLIQDELRAVIPQGKDCTPSRVKAAMDFLCDEWLVDAATAAPNEDEQTLRDYLLTGTQPNFVFSTKTIGKRLKQHLDEPVRSGERTLVLRSWEDKHVKLRVYGVRTITTS